MSEDWEDVFIQKLEEMLRTMGANVDASMLRGMMSFFRSQFERMGIDPAAFAADGVDLRFDASDLQRWIKGLTEGGSPFEEMLQNLGMEINVDAGVEVDLPGSDDEISTINPSDVYLEGWNMVVTLDLSMRTELTGQDVELGLSGAQQLDVMRTTQLQPVVRYELPHPVEDIVDWTFTNSILDVTLRLRPRGSLGPSIIPIVDEDDDDDDEDGGIPIL